MGKLSSLSVQSLDKFHIIYYVHQLLPNLFSSTKHLISNHSLSPQTFAPRKTATIYILATGILVKILELAPTVFILTARDKDNGVCGECRSNKSMNSLTTMMVRNNQAFIDANVQWKITDVTETHRDQDRNVTGYTHRRTLEFHNSEK